MARVVSSTPVDAEGFRFLRLRRIEYKDPEGTTRQWESCERTTRCGDIDAVDVVAIVRAAERPPRVLLVSQFRPPVGRQVMEFPAGLVDPGETAEQAAVRELAEETGYVGRPTGASPAVCFEPGMTNSNLQAVFVDIDADAPENANPVPRLEEDEFITVHLLPLVGLRAALDEMEAIGRTIDSRLYSWACGLEVGASVCGAAAAAAAAPAEPAAPAGAPAAAPAPAEASARAEGLLDVALAALAGAVLGGLLVWRLRRA